MREPEFLYKFRSLFGEQQLERAKATVDDSTLYFSRAREFNDPFDCLPRRSLEATVQERAKWMFDRLGASKPELNRMQRKREALRVARLPAIIPDSEHGYRIFDQTYQRALDRLGILSLSATLDPVLLWSHYADSHRGIALRYAAGPAVDFFGRAQPVRYSDERPILNIFKQKIEEQIDIALMRKAGFWSYEQEWRIFDHQSGPGLKRFPPELLTGIIFGLNVSDDLRSKIERWVRGRSPAVEILRAELDPEKFALRFVPA